MCIVSSSFMFPLSEVRVRESLFGLVATATPLRPPPGKEVGERRLDITMCVR